MRRLLALFLSGCLLAASSIFASAQTVAYAEIVSVDTQNFPQISALLDVFNANGGFESNLQPSDLTVYEDGQPRPVDALTQLEVPAQIVVQASLRRQNTSIVEKTRPWCRSRSSETISHTSSPEPFPTRTTPSSMESRPIEKMF